MPRKISAPLSLFFATATLAWALPAAAVDLNTADAETLSEELVGVGEVRARAIVDYREDHGRFESAGELTEVHGIGSATLEKNRDSLAIDAPEE